MSLAFSDLYKNRINRRGTAQRSTSIEMLSAAAQGEAYSMTNTMTINLRKYDPDKHDSVSTMGHTVWDH